MNDSLDRHYLVELQVSVDRVPQLRRIAAAHLRHWGLDTHVPPVSRGMEELLSNVHRHVGAANQCVVEIRLTGRHLTVSVADNGRTMPKLLDFGGGLSRVGTLSDSWGHCRTTDGKVVWFTRRTDAPRSSDLLPRAPLAPTSELRPQPLPALV